MTVRLLATYLALTLAVLASLEIPLALVQASNERSDLTAKVERDAFVVAALAEDALQAQRSTPALTALAARYRAETGGRVVLVDKHGRSLADSKPTTPGERNFATRPEVAAALAGRTVAGIRTSRTLHEKLLYVAVPVSSGGTIYGAVRITYPTATLDRRVRHYRVVLVLVGALILALAAAIGTLLARSFAGPLRRVERVAEAVGTGNLGARAPEGDGPPEVRRLARELNASTAKLATLLASQESFVADASHELRTPLTALRLTLEIGDTAAALVEADRLQGLVDDLLTLARADSSKERPVGVELDHVVAARAAAWAPAAARAGVTLEVETGGTTVRAGRRRVEQVLDNLIANAIAVAPRDTTVILAARGPELHVIDEGPGLGAEERTRAFDRFWRTGRGPGSGLGLAIVRRLVELDGGTARLDPAASGGIDAIAAYPPVSS